MKLMRKGLIPIESKTELAQYLDCLVGLADIVSDDEADAIWSLSNMRTSGAARAVAAILDSGLSTTVWSLELEYHGTVYRIQRELHSGRARIFVEQSPSSKGGVIQALVRRVRNWYSERDYDGPRVFPRFAGVHPG